MSLTKATFSMINGAVANVLDYGADPSGVIDSTAAIQLCLDENPLGFVYFPEGTYKVTDTLTIAGGAQNITGDGQRSIILVSGLASGQSVFQNYGTNGSRRSNQIFENIQIFSVDGNGVGIALEFIERGVFRNIWFYGLETMVEVTDQCYICLFQSLTGLGITEKSFSVIAPAFNNNTFVNCTFGGKGFLLVSESSQGIQFTGCDFEGCSYDATYPATAYFKITSSTELTGISGITFSGCYWENNDADAIHLNAQGISGSSKDGISGVSISGCFFTGGYGDVGHTNAKNVLFAFNAHAISVTGNYFSDFKDYVVFDGGGNGPWLFESNYIGKNLNGVERIPAFASTGKVLGGPGGYVKNNGLLTRREFQGTAIPTTGTFIQGDIVWNNAPTAGAYEKWICVSAGTPGTWKGASLIES